MLCVHDAVCHYNIRHVFHTIRQPAIVAAWPRRRLDYTSKNFRDGLPTSIILIQGVQYSHAVHYYKRTRIFLKKFFHLDIFSEVFNRNSSPKAVSLSLERHTFSVRKVVQFS
uniref:Uncharacterized protein n=1 Tax=Cacopsylla melanoneura TaxID=428564 RepID=A0A8D8RPZ2_9HEMI